MRSRLDDLYNVDLPNDEHARLPPRLCFGDGRSLRKRLEGLVELDVHAGHAPRLFGLDGSNVFHHSGKDVEGFAIGGFNDAVDVVVVAVEQADTGEGEEQEAREVVAGALEEHGGDQNPEVPGDRDERGSVGLHDVQ